MNVVVWGHVKIENNSFPVAVRDSKTRLLKLPNVSQHRESWVAKYFKLISGFLKMWPNTVSSVKPKPRRKGRNKSWIRDQFLIGFFCCGALGEHEKGMLRLHNYFFSLKVKLKRLKPSQEELFIPEYTSAEPFVNVWILEHSFFTPWITERKKKAHSRL